MMPFTIEQFLEVLAKYNQAVYPIQFLLVGASLLVICLAFQPSQYSNKFISAILALFWLWMGIVYHLIFFSAINPAAYIFGGFFILQGVILLYTGVWKNSLSFHFYPDAKGLSGILLVLYALILYPVLGSVFGHPYPQLPTFGLPCPTTIFTFGLLLWTNHKVDWFVWVIPLVWSLIGASAAFLLGIREDFGLLLAGLIGLTFLLWHKPGKVAII